MDAQQDALFLTPSWCTDTTSLSQFGNPSWDTQSWEYDDVDMDNFFCLPPPLDECSDTDDSPVDASPTEPRQNLADFYWSLAATGQSTVAPGKLAIRNQAKPLTTSSISLPDTWQSYCSPLSPPGRDQFLWTESEQGTPPQLDCPLSPTSSSGSASPAATRAPGRASVSPNKKMLRTSIRKSSTKATIKQEPEASPKDIKMRRARSCHNMVEKKYRNRLNNHFELLLTTVTETRKRVTSSQAGVSGLGGDIEVDMDSGDDVESSSLSYKGGDKDQKDRSMSKSDVLGLARETVISLERKNKLLTEEVKRLRGLREAAIPGRIFLGF